MNIYGCIEDKNLPQEFGNLKIIKLNMGEIKMKITCPRCKRRMRIRRGERKSCYCGKYLDYRTFFRKKIPYDVYLLDANVFIYAFSGNDYKARSCRRIIFFNSNNIKIGTTHLVLDEIGRNIRSQIPTNIILYKTGIIFDELLNTSSNFLKQPSEVDLSLINASIEHPEIHGLVTYDMDFSNVAAAGMVDKRSSRKFWLGNAEKFTSKKLKMYN